jgi:hypothetical protein
VTERETEYACLRSFTAGSAWHQAEIKEYRRDLVRRRYICPNAPACTNCYYQNQVIAYEIGTTGCWFDLPQFCSNGGIPCCSALCEYGPLTPCYSC